MFNSVDNYHSFDIKELIAHAKKLSIHINSKYYCTFEWWNCLLSSQMSNDRTKTEKICLSRADIEGIFCLKTPKERGVICVQEARLFQKSK